MTDEAAIRYERVCHKKPACQVTLMAHIPHAPFPYDGPVGDSGQPFFDHSDPVSGQRMHTVGEGIYYSESPHYRNNRVLIHLPPHFKPEAPFEILLFFHGHNAELNRTLVGEMALLQQLNAVDRNLLLVAPQLVLDAADSSPGKLYRSRGVDKMLRDLTQVLGEEKGESFAARFGRAPVLLAAFSGGYRALAYSLERGFADEQERDKRVKGVLLLDGLYGELDRYTAWLWHRNRRGFFVNLYGPSSAPFSRELEQKLEAARVPWSETLPKKIRSRAICSLMVETPHASIFWQGPPRWPLVEILKRLATSQSPGKRAD
ncbi:MAG: hypothetical protein HQL90_00040 [Magnetococcales bacterium]|nr:hypothetical protein [Magnetococcales bacterium]